MAIERAGRGGGMNGLSGRVALVTGASGGIGAAVARSLADQGVRLGLASRSGGDLGIDGSIATACDIRDAAAVDALVERVVGAFGQLDLVIANAGVGAYGPFLELDPGHLEEMIDTNVKGTRSARRCRTCWRATGRTSSRSRRRRGVAASRSRRSTARRSSRRSDSRAPWTTSSGRGASGARTCAPEVWRPSSRWAGVERPRCPSSPG